MRRALPGKSALAAALTAALALIAPGCGEHSAGAPPDVVLITIDTLRADHLGCYGYDRPTSPRIDAFARGATRYTRSVSSAPWTLPSHASLFTGRNPSEHGAHTFLDPGGRAIHENPLPASQVTLPALLAAEGYHAAAFVANAVYLGRRWRLDPGFETWEVYRHYGRDLNARVFRWLDGRPEGPFFLFVNYIDTHRPYNTAPRPGFLDPPATRDRGELIDRLYRAVMPGEGPVPADLVRRVIDQYDTAIANVDAEFGRLLDDLVRRGIYDDALIVLTSDHGEYFGEHHLAEHSKDLYEEALRVPLIIKSPGQREGAVSDTLISSVDVAGRIVSRLGGDLARRLGPRFPNAPGNHPVIAENYYTRAKDLFHPVWGHRFRRVRAAIYDGPWKYIASSDGLDELYRLDRDPEEAVDQIAQEGDVARALAGRLRAWRAGHRPATERVETPPLSREEREDLRALGYLGGGNP